jgi:molybdopterin adenylyltransferase
VELVTVSSSRYEAKKSGKPLSDESGDVADQALRRLGFKLTARDLVSDDKQMIETEVKRFLSGSSDAMIFLGGTGASTRDITIETVRPFLEKELDGFGELFRKLSFDEIGSAAMMTRATAGVAKGKLLVCLPGSPAAARLALERFGGEFPHAIYIART